MWVSFTSLVAGSSIGRRPLAAWSVKWLRMSTKIPQSAMRPVLEVSSTKVPFEQRVLSKGGMALSLSAIMMTNSAGSTVNPAGELTTRSRTVFSASTSLSSGTAMVTSAVAEAAPAGMVKVTLPVKAV